MTDSREDLLRQFQQIVSGAELADLRTASGASTFPGAAFGVVPVSVLPTGTVILRQGTGGIPPLLLDLAARSELGEHLARTIYNESKPRPDAALIANSLQPHLWFLKKAAANELHLTAAGYMKPALVEEVAPLIPSTAGWIGKLNREDLTPPVADFRDLMTKPLGLLRKYKQELRSTKAAKTLTDNSDQLFEHIASCLYAISTTGKHRFDREANLLVLAAAAAGPGEQLPLDAIAAALTGMGYGFRTGEPIDRYVLYQDPASALRILDDIAAPPFERRRSNTVSEVASALARAALLTEPSGSPD